MNMGAEQLSFDQWMAFFRPLMPIPDVVLSLTASRESVHRLIDAGSLRAVNIGLGKQARELRIYKYAVIHILAGRTEEIETIPVAKIMPHSRPDMLVRELTELFACTDQHIYNLAARDEIKTRSGVSLSSQKRMPRYTRESVIAFLEKREVS